MVIQGVLSETVTGQELRQRREALGLTQEGLSKELDVTANTIARWERGEVPKTGILPAWVPKIMNQIELSRKKGTPKKSKS